METENEINPQGYVKLLTKYLDMLRTRKLVALFNDYETAKDDILLELTNNQTKEYIDVVKYIINNFSKVTYVKDWFNEL
jgi:hypothetical protein